MENESLILFKDFVFEFPKGANHDIYYDNFTIDKGDLVLITGENGVGKTTLFNLFGVNDRKDQSFIDACTSKGGLYLNFDGFDPNISLFDYKEKNRSKLARRKCYVEQKDEYEPFTSAYSVILKDVKVAVDDNEFYDHNKRKELINNAIALIKSIFDKYLASESFTFAKFKYKAIQRYSGGESKLLSIIKTLVKADIIDSKLIMMDEPLNNLDAKNKRIVNNLINDFRNNHKDSAILIISHCHIFQGITKIINFEETDTKGRFEAKLLEPSKPQNCLLSKSIIVKDNMYVNE